LFDLFVYLALMYFYFSLF